MAVSFPQDPSNGDTFISGNSYFEFSDGRWNALNAGISTVTDFTVTDELNVKTITSDFLNITYGKNAALAVTGDEGSVSIGYSAAKSASSIENTIVIGGRSARDATSLKDCVIIGDASGTLANVGISSCTFLGRASGVRCNGVYNTFLGAVSGQGLTLYTGQYNTGLGALTLSNISTTSQNNTAVGAAALNGLTTANNNTCLGTISGSKVTTGSNNTFIGASAGNLNITGTDNIAIGWNANVPDTSVGHIAIGPNTLSNINEDKSLVIGNGADAWIVGDENFNLTTPNTFSAGRYRTLYTDPGVGGGTISAETYATNTGLITLASGTNAIVFQIPIGTTSLAQFQFMIRSSDGSIKSTNGYAYTADAVNITLTDLYGNIIPFSTFNTNTTNIGVVNTNKPAYVASGLNLQFLVANDASPADVTSTWVATSRLVSYPQPPV